MAPETHLQKEQMKAYSKLNSTRLRDQTNLYYLTNLIEKRYPHLSNSVSEVSMYLDEGKLCQSWHFADSSHFSVRVSNSFATVGFHAYLNQVSVSISAILHQPWYAPENESVAIEALDELMETILRIYPLAGDKSNEE